MTDHQEVPLKFKGSTYPRFVEDFSLYGKIWMTGESMDSSITFSLFSVKISDTLAAASVATSC